MKKIIKGQIWVSAVLYMLIGSIIIILILQAGLPIIQKNKDKSIFTKTRDMFINVDNVISEVIDEGVGSQRIVSLDIPEGKVTLEDGILKWEYESDTKILEPRTAITIGNLKVVSDIDVSAYDYGTHYVMENSHIQLNISKKGTPASYDPNLNTSEIIESFYSLDTDTELASPGAFSFVLDNNPQTVRGEGYIELVPPGNNSNINFARVLVHMYNAGGHNYTLALTLDSKADFMKIDVLDFK